MSTSTTSARPASAIRWAVVAPTLPAPMTVTLFLAMGGLTSGYGSGDPDRDRRRPFYEVAGDDRPNVDGPRRRAAMVKGAGAADDRARAFIPSSIGAVCHDR